MIKDTLKNIDFFSSLNELQRDNLINMSIYEEYEKEHIIFYQGDDSTYLHILIEGTIQIQKYDDIGNPIIIAIFSKPTLFGEAASLKGIPFPSSAISKSKISLLKIKKDDFIEKFLNDIVITRNILFSLIDKVQLLQRNIHNNIATNAQDKIIYFYKNNSSFSNKLKQYEIASLLGITKETLSRNLKILVEENILKKEGKNYYINI
jgi:CRP/FNR family transcriptional regulator